MKHIAHILPFFVIAFLIVATGCETKSKPAAAGQSVDSKDPVSSSDPASPGDQQSARPKQDAPNKADDNSDEKVESNDPKWIGDARSLFDGETLDGWETIEFGGEGDVAVEEDSISMEAGVMLTGVCATNEDLPTTNYEISLEARKIDGTDFLLGLTFPVAESHCTLIAGGWGGTLVGLSCINDQDASSNDTAAYIKFEAKQWYKFKVRVEPEQITTWIDGEKVIDKNIAGKRISLRGDTDLCKPLGICNFMTSSQYKNIQLREFEPRQDSGKSPKTETKVIKKSPSLELSAPADHSSSNDKQ